MSDFEPGDIVECMEPDFAGFLALGARYTVIKREGYLVSLKEMPGFLGFGASRFRLVPVKVWPQPTEPAEPVTPAAAYPDNNPKTVVGLTKPSVSAIPPIAIFKIGQAMADGKRKYGQFNWREKRVSGSVYVDAAMRHLMAWWDGEEQAADSGFDHLAHAAACLCILMDAQSLGQLNDDRCFPGALPQFLADQTKKAV